MGQFNRRAVLSIFGLAGSGKTRYARSYLENFNRAVIVDGGFDGEDDFPGVRVSSWWEFRDYMLKNLDGLFRVRFCPTRAEFPFVCRMVREAGDCVLIVDEADRFLTREHLDEEFLDLVSRSRHYGVAGGVSIVVIAQNPMQIPIDARRQSTSVVVFNTAEPADVDWLRKMIGDEWAARAPWLKEDHGIEWVKGEGAREFMIMPDGEVKPAEGGGDGTAKNAATVETAPVDHPGGAIGGASKGGCSTGEGIRAVGS